MYLNRRKRVEAIKHRNNYYHKYLFYLFVNFLKEIIRKYNYFLGYINISSFFFLEQKLINLRLNYFRERESHSTDYRIGIHVQREKGERDENTV